MESVHQGASATETIRTYPSVLHVGSGKNFKPGMLNIDCNPIWQPDIVADLNLPFPRGTGGYHTERFGSIQLLPGSFDEIIANDVIEHIRELPTVMESCLVLLREGGTMRISVPYELSLGAWSDPTHVRAFNERTWDYFTIWSWYLGWEEHTFVLGKLEFVASDYGITLQQGGMTLEELLRTPRAIDSMSVDLVKAAQTEESKVICRKNYGRVRS